MKSWKEENLIGFKEDSQLDFNDISWKDTKHDLVKTNKFKGDPDTILAYAKMCINAAQRYDKIEDWFNYCNEFDNYGDIKKKYGRKAAPRIYQRIQQTYEDAKKGIVTISSSFRGTLKKLLDANLIDNLEDQGAYCKFILV